MDPRTVGPQQRSANLSRLMLAKTRASMGEKVNFCPFGCGPDELDEHGYCRHLAGFTVPGDEANYEPRVPRHGRNGEIIGYFVDGTQIQPVQRGDKLEKITVSSRVYRDVDKAKTEAKK